MATGEKKEISSNLIKIGILKLIPDPILPVEILSMDNNSIQLYKKALHAGMEKFYNIRVMVVGQFGVGKTTLIKRLLGQPVDISERKSTEGIDVHKHCCKISLDKGEWIQQVEASAGPMPSAPFSDKDRFMCIAYLLNDVGSKVLRQLFQDMATPTCTLDQYLANNRSKIDSLLKKKVLNVSQMVIMFPPNGDPTNLTDYDITLLSALFNNIMPSLGHQEKNLIKHLRDNRNKLYGHTKSCKMNASDFQTCWSDISSTLKTLSQQCVDTNFKNEISMEIQQTQVPDASYLSMIHNLYSRIERIEQRLESNNTSTSET